MPSIAMDYVYRGLSVLTAILMLQAVLVISQDCTYLYIEQPPETIDCNPYQPARSDEVLRLQCALTAPSGSPLVFNWYLNSTNLSRITNGLESSMPNDTTFRSVLTLSNPSFVSDSGDYFCQAEVEGTPLQPSESFTLSDNQFEYINDPECIDASIFFREATLCADIAATEPVLTSTTSPLQPTSSQTIFPTTLPSPQQTVSTSTEPETTTSSTPEDMMPNGMQAWIYVLAVVVAVFGIIIVVLFIGLCLRRKRIHDPHTLNRPTIQGAPIYEIVDKDDVLTMKAEKDQDVVELRLDDTGATAGTQPVVPTSQNPAYGHVLDTQTVIPATHNPAYGHVLDSQPAIPASQNPAYGQILDSQPVVPTSQNPAYRHVQNSETIDPQDYDKVTQYFGLTTADASC